MYRGIIYTDCGHPIHCPRISEMKSTKYSLERTAQQEPTRSDYAQWADTPMILQIFPGH